MNDDTRHGPVYFSDRGGPTGPFQSVKWRSIFLTNAYIYNRCTLEPREYC